MPRWFLSYHSPDQVLAERLKAGIERIDLNETPGNGVDARFCLMPLFHRSNLVVR